MDNLLTPETRDLTWHIVKDDSFQMSRRLMSLVLYSFIRVCEFVDYWFPVKKKK
jgi:hypothetical protein